MSPTVKDHLSKGRPLSGGARAVGESLGARVELSRTCMEVGKRLIEAKSRFKELNGIPAKGYLEKAKGLFEEMGLERDLDELDRITS